MKQNSFASLLAGNIVYRSLNIVISILTTFALTRLLSTSGYGLLSLLVANASVLNLITCLGCESGLTYHSSTGDISRRGLLSITYSIIFFQLVIWGLVEAVYYTISAQHLLLNGDNGGALWWGLGYFICIILIDKYTSLLNGIHQYTLANKSLFISNLFGLMLLGWAYFFYKGEHELFYLKLFILASVLQLIGLFISFHFITRNKFEWERLGAGSWKIFFNYSFVAYISNIVQFFAYRLDYWILDFYRGKEQVGLYSLAVKLGQLLWILPLLFASIILPAVARKNREYSDRLIFSLIRISNTFLVVVSIMVIIFAGWLIPWFAGESYTNSVTPFMILIPGILLFGTNILLAAYFAGNGKLYYNLAGSAICLAVILTLDFVLIPKLGVNGAAIASSIGYGISTFFLVNRFLVYTKKSIAEIGWMKKADFNEGLNLLKNSLHL